MEFSEATNQQISNAKLRKLFNKSGGICFYCQDPMKVPPNVKRGSPFYPSRDHFIPLSEGGLKDESNVVPAHVMCNNLKANHLPSDEMLERFEAFKEGAWPIGKPTPLSIKWKTKWRWQGVKLTLRLGLLTGQFYIMVAFKTNVKIVFGFKRGPWFNFQISLTNENEATPQ